MHVAIFIHLWTKRLFERLKACNVLTFYDTLECDVSALIDYLALDGRGEAGRSLFALNRLYQCHWAWFCHGTTLRLRFHLLLHTAHTVVFARFVGLRLKESFVWITKNQDYEFNCLFT